jgi:hypothetical protein
MPSRVPRFRKIASHRCGCDFRLMVILSPRALGFACAALVLATGVSGQPVARATRGDTAVAITRGPGRWGPVFDAVEVARVAEESEETTFGAVFMIAPTADGGVLVFDMKALEGPILRQFSAAGKFVRNIGRSGAGPGEYSMAAMVAFTAASDGTIIVRDGRRMVNRYAPDGRFMNGFAHGYASTLELYAESPGTVLMRAGFDPRGNPSDLPPLIRHAADGRVLDTIRSPIPWYAGPSVTTYDTRNYWLPYPDGRILQFRSDKVGFLLTDPRGRTKPVMAEVPTPAVEYLPDERAELQRAEEWRRRISPPELHASIGRVPTAKPVVRNYAFTDLSGRIWLQRSAPAVRAAPRVVGKSGTDSVTVSYDEPRLFAVFEPDGTYLGEVRFPVGVLPAVVGDVAWGITRGADDEPVLVKYRIRR